MPNENAVNDGIVKVTKKLHEARKAMNDLRDTLLYEPPSESHTKLIEWLDTVDSVAATGYSITLDRL